MNSSEDPLNFTAGTTLSTRHYSLLNAATSVLVVVDMQEPFLNVMHGREALITNVLLLCRAARLQKIPIILTTQYGERMGTVLSNIADAAGDVRPVDKLVFSAVGSPAFRSLLPGNPRQQVVVCGLETHICVSQTAHDLMHIGYQVHVAADAVSARTLERHKLGMERVRDAGAHPCAAEGVVYEWLYEAGTPLFKEALKLVKGY